MLNKFQKLKKNIYLDYAAATPLDSKVQKAMKPFLSEAFGNPSSLHSKGREAKQAIAKARKKISLSINSKPSEIVFTSGGTESVNLAIFGVAGSIKENKKFHFITSTVEHDCVIKSFEVLAGEGHKTSFVKTDKYGMVDFNKLKKTITPQTVFISIMYANNEIGTIQPLAEIGKWLKLENQKRAAEKLPKIIFHTDACQAPGFLDLDVHKLGVDLMSVNGGKIYGPKQTGFLYIKEGLCIRPQIYGGGQERGIRSGTENVPGIVGLASALEFACINRKNESTRLCLLRDYFISKVKKYDGHILLNGPDETSSKVKGITRLPNNINLTVNGIEGETLVLYLDACGIQASTGSACESGTGNPSKVLIAIGKSASQANSSIRFSMGKSTNKNDLNKVIKIFFYLIKNLKNINTLL